MKTELPFTLDGVAGELKIVAGFSKLRFYQNGQELKKSGTFKPTYTVTTTDGNTTQVKVLNNAIKGYMVEYNGQRVSLQPKLSAIETVLLFIPIIIFIAGIILYGGMIGVLGGAIIGACAALSVLIPGNLLRQFKGLGMQLLIVIMTGLCLYGIYFLLSVLLAGAIGSFLYF